MLHSKWRGIYFTDAAETCSSEQLDTLVKTLEQSHKLLLGPPSSPNPAKTPGWNRFFLNDDNVADDEGWSGEAQQDDFMNVMRKDIYLRLQHIWLTRSDNFQQAQHFPEWGTNYKWKTMKPGSRITFTCKEPKIAANRCKDKGSGAFRFPGSHADSDGYGDVIVFCPAVFGPKYKDMDELINGRRKSISYLPQLWTKAHAMTHEIFHCQRALKTQFLITDIYDNVAGITSKKAVYGPEYCARYARKNATELTLITADSYAWLLSFNWLNYYFDWQSNGDYEVDIIHDEVKRDTQTDSTDNDADIDVEHDPDSMLDGDSIDVNEVYPQANCAQVGSDPMNVKCEYVDEDYDDWVEDHPHPSVSRSMVSATATPTSTPLVSATPTPTPSATGSATCEVIFEDELSSTKDWMYKVIVSGDWATQDAIKSGVEGCVSNSDDLTAWIWEDQGDGTWMAAFDLKNFEDENCVPDAIQSASDDLIKDVSCPVHNGADPTLSTRLMMEGASG
ncbi:hypothetical protein N7497_012052 [Penicillium chrysogenum]|nr:hypothetical protein N7497_012052 [Penicillium chrysogenum]